MPGISFLNNRPRREPFFFSGVGVGFAASRLGEGDGDGEGLGSGVGLGLGVATTTGCAGRFSLEPTASAIPINNTAATIIANILNLFLARSEPVREREILGKGSLFVPVSAAGP